MQIHNTSFDMEVKVKGSETLDRLYPTLNEIVEYCDYTPLEDSNEFIIRVFTNEVDIAYKLCKLLSQYV